jgi:transposase-like protein
MAGRPRDPQLEVFWRRHIDRQLTSGSSVRGYCRRHGLQDAAFYAWRRRLAQRKPATASPHASTPTPAFLPIAIVDTPTPRRATVIEIVLTDGRRVRVRAGCDRQLLADILALLSPPARGEGRPC